MKKLLFLALGVSVFVFAVAAFGEIYKWTDEEGKIHYSDIPPQQNKAQEIEIRPTPSQPKPKSTLEQVEESKRLQPTPPHKQPPMGRSLALKDLGPLPEAISSTYLETKSAGIVVKSWKKRTAMYSILLSAKPSLPFGAYLEAQFDNPEDPDASLVVGKARQGGQQIISIISPEFKGLKCWNYQAVIYVYRGRSKSQRLGIHRQTIQSRVNLEKVKSANDILEAGQRGNCP
ncbi:MAG: DUF4124 domain-containing protein [candidate division NC10 bacterium]